MTPILAHRDCWKTNDRILKVKFYLKNGPVDPKTNETTVRGRIRLL